MRQRRFCPRSIAPSPLTCGAWVRSGRLPAGDQQEDRSLNLSEPASKADRIHLLSPWLYHWWVHDDRIDGFRSEAYAVLTPDGKVLIDPLPLAPKALAGLGPVAAICLTQRNHQRSAWAYRRLLRVPVYVPEGDYALEEEPDQSFGAGQRLPGPLTAVATTGLPHGFSLLVATDQGSGALFCGDLITCDEGGPYRLPVQPGFIVPAEAREGLKRLAELPAETLCPAHGAPSVTGCQAIVRGVLSGEDAAGA